MNLSHINWRCETSWAKLRLMVELSYLRLLPSDLRKKNHRRKARPRNKRTLPGPNPDCCCLILCMITLFSCTVWNSYVTISHWFQLTAGDWAAAWQAGVVCRAADTRLGKSSPHNMNHYIVSWIKQSPIIHCVMTLSAVHLNQTILEV